MYDLHTVLELYSVQSSNGWIEVTVFLHWKLETITERMRLKSYNENDRLFGLIFEIMLVTRSPGVVREFHSLKVITVMQERRKSPCAPLIINGEVG